MNVPWLWCHPWDHVQHNKKWLALLADLVQVQVTPASRPLSAWRRFARHCLFDRHLLSCIVEFEVNGVRNANDACRRYDAVGQYAGDRMWFTQWSSWAPYLQCSLHATTDVIHHVWTSPHWHVKPVYDEQRHWWIGMHRNSQVFVARDCASSSMLMETPLQLPNVTHTSHFAYSSRAGRVYVMHTRAITADVTVEVWCMATTAGTPIPILVNSFQLAHLEHRPTSIVLDEPNEQLLLLSGLEVVITSVVGVVIRTLRFSHHAINNGGRWYPSKTAMHKASGLILLQPMYSRTDMWAIMNSSTHTKVKSVSFGGECEQIRDFCFNRSGSMLYFVSESGTSHKMSSCALLDWLSFPKQN